MKKVSKVLKLWNQVGVLLMVLLGNTQNFILML